jgi:NADH-quinone oxidoreductase subunit E
VIVILPEGYEVKATELISRYPDSLSAIMPLLYLAQEYYGVVNQEGIAWISAKLDISPVRVMEIATFYTMYYTKNVGKYHIQVCRTLSCALCGARDLIAKIKEKLDLKSREISEDGTWSYEEVECLGSCGTAPMVQINDRFFENLTPETLSSLIDFIQQDGGDLRYSTLRENIGDGCPQWSKSKVI